MTVAGVATQRVRSMDALRAFLVAWIIAGHALLGYAAVGGWAYDEVAEATFTPAVEWVLAAVIGPTALFLMGTFFLISGLFTPASLARKGPREFLRGRLLRLGLPYLLMMLVVWPATLWLAYRAAGRSVSYGWLLTGRQRLLDAGALWFVAVLLLFSAGYLLSQRIGPTDVANPLSGRHLALLAVAVAAVSFVVRLVLPARGPEVGDLHMWQWPQLLALFGLGIAGARFGMAERVPPPLVRTCGFTVLTTVVLAPVVALLIGVDNVADAAPLFLGGWHWQAVLLAVVEAILVVAGSVWLVGFGQRRFDGSSPFAVRAARASLAAFVLQSPVLIGLAIALRPVVAPAEVKAPVVAALGVAGCFWLGSLLVRKTALGRVL